MKIVLCFVVLISFVVAASAVDLDTFEGPFTVEVEPLDVSFQVDGPAGTYDANTQVNVSVRSGFLGWSLYLQATPLIEEDAGWVMPASRICLAGGYTDVLMPSETCVSLDQPVMIGSGSFTGPEFSPASVLDLKFRSQWKDRPGVYHGEIVITFLAEP